MTLLFDPLAPSIFHEGWWLDVVSGGRCAEVTSRSGGRVVGRLPYVLLRSSLGQVACGMPAMTHFLGPAVDEGRGAACNRVLKRDQIIRDLLSQLPKTSGFDQKMYGGITDVMIFQESGFRTSVQFTYEIAPASEEFTWSQMRDKTRNAIRHAEKQFSISHLVDMDEFASAYVANLRATGIRSNIGAALMVKVCTEAVVRNRGRVLAARRSDGRLVAAIFYVWDAKTAYYLLTTRAEDAGNGAVSALIWQAIKDAAARNVTFDFDGVATHGSRLFFTGFGGKVVPRYIVSRFSLLHKVVSRSGSLFFAEKNGKYLH